MGSTNGGSAHAVDREDLAADSARLIEFLRNRDVACPACGYNLRDLATAVCPECMLALSLTVGATDLRMGWLLATIAPGIFSGIAAGLLLIPLVGVPATGGGTAPWFLMAIDAFGWVSGVAAVLVVWKRVAFFRLGRDRQIAAASLAWVIHLLAFAFLLTMIFG